jgi:hypothetical protein
MDITYNDFANNNVSNELPEKNQKKLFFVMAALIIFIDLTSTPHAVVGNCPVNVATTSASSN